MPFSTFKITIEYDGTPFVGWQRQAQGPQNSIQGLLEEALSKFFNEAITIQGSGRTDTGVHARAQVASFRAQNQRSPEALVKAVNCLLPEAIAVTDAQKVPDDFHARFNAKGKVYDYDFYVAATRSALLAKRALQVGPDINWKQIEKALQYLLGEHDFKAFQSTGSEVKSTVRIITSAALSKPEENIVRLSLAGNGFLRHMVRSIAGTLLLVGRQKISPEDFQNIILKKDRSQAGPTLAAHGLYLTKVIY